MARRNTMSKKYPYRKGRGPNGRRFCRYCGEEVPKGRLYWCCAEHVHLALVECDPNYQRNAVKKRDKGVCADCGTDTVELKRLVMELVIRSRPEYDQRGFGDHTRMYDVLQGLGFKRNQSLWEMDHIVPVIEGGQNTLDNLRTLCVPCHKRDTAEVVKRLAIRRKQDKIVPSRQLSLLE